MLISKPPTPKPTVIWFKLRLRPKSLPSPNKAMSNLSNVSTNPPRLGINVEMTSERSVLLRTICESVSE